MTETGGNSCKLPLKTTEEGQIEEAITSLAAAAEEISVDASAVLSERHGIFTFRGEKQH